MKNFRRGHIFDGVIPRQTLTDQTPPPSFVLYGNQRLIVLHDSDFKGIDGRMALVVPITSAKAEKAKAVKEGRSILESLFRYLQRTILF